MPSKRSRRVDDDEGTIVDVQEASSSFRASTSRKRARISNAKDRDDTPESDSEQDDQAEAVSPPKTQYEILRDGNFGHLGDEARDMERATQKLRSRPSQIGDNHAAECGIIESITCTNFMCHERLRVELGPLLNFIVGENGSGKSAVLTAITLCLGGKASATNRGSSLKDLIKQGRDHAVIEVKIKNQGHDAYQPDLYGPSIIVERHFNRAGNSGFKIKSATGRIISTKKPDVDDIIEYLCLQVDNPMNILSQDNARQFLNQASPAQKYKFFVQGVQLEQLDNDYRLLHDYCESVGEHLRNHHENLIKRKEEYDKAKALADTIAKNSEIRAKQTVYRNQLAWAQVEEQERDLRKHEANVVAFDAHIAEAGREVDAHTERMTRADQELDRANQALSSLQQEQGSYDIRVKEADEAFQKAKKELMGLQVDERELQAKAAQAHAEVEDFQAKIAEEARKILEKNGNAPALKQQELEDVKEHIAELEQKLRDLPVQRNRLQQEADAAQKEAEHRDKLCKAKKSDILTADDRLKSLQSSGGSEALGFDPRMRILLRNIENDDGFEQKPIGPLGSHIQLLKPAWSSVIEKALGPALDGFIVVSVRDSRRLLNHVREAGLRRTPAVYIANRQRINLQGKEPDKEFDTILRVLKIENPMILDQLVINFYIEQTILVADRKEGEELILSGGPRMRHVNACISHFPNKRDFGIRMSARQGYKSETIDPYKGPPRMKSDRDSQVAILRDVRNQLGIEFNDLERHLRQAQQALNKARSELAALAKTQKNLESELRHTRVKADNLVEEIEGYEGASGRLEILRTELAEAEEKERQEVMQLLALRDEKPRLNRRAEDLKRQLEAEKDVRKDFGAKMAKYEAKVAAAQDVRRIALSEKNAAIENRDVKIAQKAQAERKVVQARATVEDFIRQAAEVCPQRVHIPEGETHQSIEAKFIALQQRLDRLARITGFTDDEIHERRHKAQAAFEQTKAEIDQIEGLQSLMASTLQQRLQRYRKFQREITARSRMHFLYLLSERGFRGTLIIDPRRLRLDMTVEPDETKSSAAGRSTKTLSGGEKSFSSICLLLSIWEAMGSPLRCLDEFDVFMDNVNRRISTNMLIQAARRSVGRQYILITPNAIEGRATLDKDVKIIRLTDPRQRTLV